MHKNRRSSKSAYYAKILFAISFTLLLYGIFLDSREEQQLINPANDVIVESDTGDSTVHIETADETDKRPATQPSNQTNSNTNTNKNTTTNNRILTIDEVNNSIRGEIQNKYGIIIKYGNETSGYSISGIATEPITDSTVINSQLVRLRESLKVYPEGLFREIKNGGIPLTIMLVNKYSDDAITGITDSSYSDATISIAAAHTFEDTFYHESYHYIERYLFKKGANYNSWDALNPSEFIGWGNIDGSLSYSTTFSQTAGFVNNYAQSEATEDRASTFEYMMAPSKASCLNRGNTVWRKAKLIADTMDLVLSSVSPSVTEYWERYL